MKACNDIQFLSSFYAESKAIGQRIKNELPYEVDSITKDEGMILQIVQFKDMENFKGFSNNLEALADKIDDMICRGRAKDVEIMLRSILTGKIKVWSFPDYSSPRRNKRREKKANYDVVQFHYSNDDKYCEGEKQEFCYGHFRWNHGRGYILNEAELKKVKEYFKL